MRAEKKGTGYKIRKSLVISKAVDSIDLSRIIGSQIPMYRRIRRYREQIKTILSRGLTARKGKGNKDISRVNKVEESCF